MVINHRQDDEQVKILKRCWKTGGKDWLLDAMLNAFCQSGATVSFVGVSTAQFGDQPDTDESLPFFRWRGPKGLGPCAVKECVFAILETTGRVECKLGVMSNLFYSNRDQMMEACLAFETNLRFDDNKLYSYSTGRTRVDGTCYDSDADWVDMCTGGERQRQALAQYYEMVRLQASSGGWHMVWVVVWLPRGSGGHRQVLDSKIAKCSSYCNMENLWQILGVAVQSVFMPQPTPAIQIFYLQIISNEKHSFQDIG